MNRFFADIAANEALRFKLGSEILSSGLSHAYILHGPVAADKRDGQDAAEALKAPEITDEALAAPDTAVRAVAGAVPDEADDFFFKAVVGHAGGHVGLRGVRNQTGYRDLRESAWLRGPGRRVRSQ